MEKTVSINPSDLPIGELHGHLLSAVAPRPIAFASTLDMEGNPNLSPFSFFNVFGSNPPILIFSPARRVRNNTTKHTLDNVLSTGEVVINIVSYNIVQQMSLSSTEYAEGVNEFEKSGLTMLPSEKVKPFRVAESPVQFECRVTKVEPLGKEGGAGNLIFSEILRMHIHQTVLDENGSIAPEKIDQVARLGGNWYSRAKSGLFEVPKPLSSLGVGVDEIPDEIRMSEVLTGNDLGLLGNVDKIPSEDEVRAFLEEKPEIQAYIGAVSIEEAHQKAQKFLRKGEVISAWKLLLALKTT